MTEPTIKEKVEELFWSYSDLETDEDCRLIFYRSFARLICEEMEKSIHCCKEDEENAKLKAQKILKALE